MQFQMKCRTKPYQGQVFTLTSEGSNLRIVDPSGKEIIRIDPADMSKLLRFPSFSDSIKYFGVWLGNGLVEFELASGEIKIVRTFVDQTSAKQNPEFAAKLRVKSIGMIVGGIAAMIAGPLASVLSYQNASQGVDNGRYFIYYGLPIFGLAILVKGIVGLCRVSALQKDSANCPYFVPPSSVLAWGCQTIKFKHWSAFHQNNLRSLNRGIK